MQINDVLHAPIDVRSLIYVVPFHVPGDKIYIYFRTYIFYHKDTNYHHFFYSNKIFQFYYGVDNLDEISSKYFIFMGSLTLLACEGNCQVLVQIGQVGHQVA